MPEHANPSRSGSHAESSAEDAPIAGVTTHDISRDKAEGIAPPTPEQTKAVKPTDQELESKSAPKDALEQNASQASKNAKKLSTGLRSTDDSDNSDNDEFKDAQSTPIPLTPIVEASSHQQLPQKSGLTEVANEKDERDSKEKDEQIAEDKDEKFAKEKNEDVERESTNDRTESQETVPPGQGDKEQTHSQGHQRGKSSNTNGISEWSHQQLAPKVAQEEPVEEDEWQTMPAFAPFDMYDDDNKLVAREKHESDDEAEAYSGLGGAGKGYTRVQMDEDAQSATSMDENTQYLFKDVNGTTAAGFEDDDERDVVSQLQATKDLLTEGQRIAYVGMTRLTLSAMTNACEALEGKTKGSRKETVLATEAMKLWSQKMMVRLYAHMDISTAEQIMIEQLSEHGVQPGDLTPTLMQNARVKNPMAEEAPSKTSLASPQPDSRSSIERSPRGSISSPRLQDEECASPPPPYVQREGDAIPDVETPAQLPTTKNIDIDLRWTILCDLFLVLIADSAYDARSRVLLERVGEHLGISWLEICRFEKRVTDALEMQQAAEKENWNEDEHKENRRKMALKKRYILMGLATVGGGLVIGLSAGVAAPFIGAGLAAGFGTIGIAGTGSFLAGAGGVALITSAAASSGSIIAARAANRRTGAVKTFEYRPLHNNKRVNLIVTVSGWMTGKVDDVRLPYSTIDPIMGDIYSVLWEPEMLTSMGDTINILATEALTQGLQQILGSTVLIGLMAAVQLPLVLTKLAYLIDNPWTVSLDRANSAGLILADSLIARNLGTRPITLVGYSLGSRVIFSCLRELARKGAHGLVQNVYLFGSPIVAKRDEYIKARTVVAGRFVNGYAKTDWILGYLFRLTSGGISRVAGLGAIEDVPGLENVDVTELVPGHMSYRTKMPRLLREVGWLVESDEFSEIEDPDPENHQKRQRELIDEIEEARKEFDKQEKEKESKGKFGFFSRSKKKVVEKKEWEMYKQSKMEGKINATGDNFGVLFDVDAIRAELASEHMEVRELQSTLPPMKLTLNPAPSTPPMLPLRETKSFDGTSTAKPPPIANYSSSSLSQDGEPHDRDIQMSFDSSYISPPRHAASRSPSRSPRLSSHLADRAAVVQRPELRNSNTEPSLMSPPLTNSPFMSPHLKDSPSMSPPLKSSPSLSPPLMSPPLTNTHPRLPSISLDHNAWADDDDEFREKEMEMTFA